MTTKFTYHIHTIASASVTVEYPPELLQSKAAELNKSVKDLTPDDLNDEFWDYAEIPSICAHCAGMNIGSDYSLELGENWDFEDE